MADQPPATGNEPAQSVTEQAREGAEKAGEKAISLLEKFFGEGNGMMVLLLVGVIVLAFILGIVLYFMTMKSIAVSKRYVLPKSKVPILCTKLTEISGTDIPQASNGKRMTVSWWMYINDLNVNSSPTIPRRVFVRGPKNETLACPYVALHGTMNKVHICWNTTDSSQFMLGGNNQSDKIPNFDTSVSKQQQLDFFSSVHGITLDYIPTQRWVHIAVVVNEESSGGIIMAYVDGELAKTVTSTTTLPNITLGSSTVPNIDNVRLEIQKLDLAIKGDVFVGGDSDDIPGFSGLVSQIAFATSDLNANDIYAMYLDGPIAGNILTKLGLPPYGVRSPMYRLG